MTNVLFSFIAFCYCLPKAEIERDKLCLTQQHITRKSIYQANQGQQHLRRCFILVFLLTKKCILLVIQVQPKIVYGALNDAMLMIVFDRKTTILHDPHRIQYFLVVKDLKIHFRCCPLQIKVSLVRVGFQSESVQNRKSLLIHFDFCPQHFCIFPLKSYIKVSKYVVTLSQTFKLITSKGKRSRNTPIIMSQQGKGAFT